MLPILDRFVLLRFPVPFGTLVVALLVVRFATGAVLASADGLLFGLFLLPDGVLAATAGLLFRRANLTR